MMTHKTVAGVVLVAVEVAGVVSGAVETVAVSGIVVATVDGDGGLPGDVVAGGAVNLRKKRRRIFNAIHFNANVIGTANSLCCSLI
jgi:hypothetical protein